MQTIAGVILALLAVAWIRAAIDGHGTQWLKSKVLGG